MSFNLEMAEKALNLALQTALKDDWATKAKEFYDFLVGEHAVFTNSTNNTNLTNQNSEPENTENGSNELN